MSNLNFRDAYEKYTGNDYDDDDNYAEKQFFGTALQIVPNTNPEEFFRNFINMGSASEVQESVRAFIPDFNIYSNGHGRLVKVHRSGNNVVAMLTAEGAKQFL